MPESTPAANAAPTPPPTVGSSLSIIIPAYDEEKRIEPTLEAIRQWAAGAGRAVELLVIDDGSEDATAEVVTRFAAVVGGESGSEPGDRGVEGGTFSVRLIRLDRNYGKGAAVRRGMLEAAGERVLMCDADLSTPIEELAKLERALDEGCDIGIGSRDLPDSRLDPPQPLTRRLLAWAFRALRRRLLLRRIRDTQCGFKLFTRAAARAVFERCVEDGWLFDCEALAIAERLGLRIREMGVVWRDDPDSRVNVANSILGSLPQLLAISRRVRGE